MIIGNDKNIATPLEFSIDNYADKLVWYMQLYLDKLQNDIQFFSSKANDKAKITLRWLVFPNDKEFKKDYKKIEDDVGTKTWNIINHYTKCIMQLVGQLTECVIVDHCSTNSDINKVCINIAKFMPNIFEDYSDIEYEKYVAFSTSFKYLIYKDEATGIYRQYNTPDYNPNHTSKDISWCKKDNILSQLKVNLEPLEYLDNAKLQIKATLDSSYLNLDGYFLTPVLCVDFSNDLYKLRKKYPNHIIYSVRELFPNMYIELEKYFKILAAYATNMIDHINITEIEVYEDYRLAELFRTPITNLVREESLNAAGVIEMAEKYRKPIIISG